MRAVIRKKLEKHSTFGDYVHCAKRNRRLDNHLSKRNLTCIQFYPCQFDLLSCKTRSASKRNFSSKVTKIHKWSSVFYLKHVNFFWYHQVNSVTLINVKMNLFSLYRKIDWGCHFSNPKASYFQTNISYKREYLCCFQTVEFGHRLQIHTLYPAINGHWYKRPDYNC